MIKMIPHFATSDGKLHTDLDKAAEHERTLIVQDLLLMNRVDLGIGLHEIEKQATTICALKDDLSKAFSADLKRGLHNGGLFKGSAGGLVGERSGETVMTRAVPPAKRTKDANGATVFIGDTVHPVSSLEADSLAKWGVHHDQIVGDITEDGCIILKGSPDLKWHPTAFRRGPAAKSAA